VGGMGDVTTCVKYKTGGLRMRLVMWIWRRAEIGWVMVASSCDLWGHTHAELR
jgi:hypothetical protein